MNRRRWLAFALFVPAYTVLLMIIGTVLFVLVLADNYDFDFSDILGDFIDLLGDGEWWSFTGTVCVIAVALQAVFLIPMFSRRPPRGERSGSLLVSLCMVGLLATLLVAGLFMGFNDILSLIMPERFPFDEEKPVLLWLLGAVVFGGWGFWTFCVLIYVRDIWPDRVLGRMVKLLLAGTGLELLIILPIQIMVRRKYDCYCATLSFFSLIIATAMALWLAGPGIFIALLSSRHRAWRRDYCGRCGYPKGPTPGEVCPECGYQWRNSPSSGSLKAECSEKGG